MCGLGPDTQQTRRVLVVIDTVTGPNFIRISKLLKGMDLKFGPSPTFLTRHNDIKKSELTLNYTK